MTAEALLTIAAILIGPVAAVVITRIIDATRLNKRRRMDVFRDLMRTRRLRLSPDHVGALNLVEIEFHGETQVVTAWKEYLTYLNKVLPDNMNDPQWDAHFKEQDRLLTILLDQMAKSLDFKIEQLDLFEGGYTPQGWEDTEGQQRALRLLLIQVLRGNRAIPTTQMVHPSPEGPYPPPPSSDS